MELDCKYTLQMVMKYGSQIHEAIYFFENNQAGIKQCTRFANQNVHHYYGA